MSILWPCEASGENSFSHEPCLSSAQSCCDTRQYMQNHLCSARKITARFPADILGRDTFTGPCWHFSRAAGGALFQPRHHLSRETSSASSRAGKGFNQPFIQLIKASMSSSRFAGCPPCEQCAFPKSSRVWQLHQGSPVQGKPKSWYRA